MVQQLQRGESVLPESFESCTLLYSDIVGFTTLASQSTPIEIVDLLNALYTTFDLCIAKFDAYKVSSLKEFK